MSPWLIKADVQIGGLPSRRMFQEVLLAQINIAKTKYRGES